MCVRLCLYIHIFTYMLLHVCRALCNKEHICIRPMHADWGVSGSISTRLCCEVHQKVSGSFSATINVSRAAADRHTWFRFNVQNAIKRTCKHSDIFFFTFNAALLFITSYWLWTLDVSFFWSSWSSSSKNIERNCVQISGQGRRIWDGRRNNELNTLFLPTATAVAVHLSVSTHVASRSTWQRRPLWLY